MVPTKFLFVTLSLLLHLAKFSHQQILSDKAVVLCGHELAMARVLICYGSEMIKKDDKYAMAATTKNNHIGDITQQWPWLSRRPALSTYWGRNKRDDSLVEECCLKPCTSDDILNYC